VIYVGVDWGEATNAVAIVDEEGLVLTQGSVPGTVEGLRKLTEMIAGQTADRAAVAIGTETDRGLLIRGLAAAGYKIYPINPLSADRYRDRHKVSGAKSDPADAVMLANVVRTDRRHHLPLVANSDLADSLKVLARRHQDLIWDRARMTLRLRSMLREFYPGALLAFGDSLNTTPCLALLEHAPTPARGRRLSQSRIVVILRKAGRQRRVAELAAEIRSALQSPQLEERPLVAQAYGESAASMARLLTALNAEIDLMEKQLKAAFSSHSDAEVIRSLPGAGMVLGARLLAEFGDQPNRYADSKSRKNFSGMAPVTRGSGKHREVSRRFAKKRRLADACYQWADCAYKVSPGAKQYYHQLRSHNVAHAAAIRSLANRLVGILHGCLKTRTPYDETIAWARYAQPSQDPAAPVAA
jgi:Transposase/Transposase IS116/IS110/IS902 family